MIDGSKAKAAAIRSCNMDQGTTIFSAKCTIALPSWHKTIEQVASHKRVITVLSPV
jgi:hypothetical protein